ncbi:acyl carrier protein [Calidifontibacter sp. DB0510]|uniref:Acyl carrier protein n=1 Tax=Metallococcus carri TaxID=1656884 RepID=A0A967B3H9_9MICO|nr:acyl carrier protein [Metallococcus carri]NHN56590.1 acyl carrier protein [Metallococcus carri]NOP38889.1 acyl carrier protein [Calidifontibacter sp. DB2511S]
MIGRAESDVGSVELGIDIEALDDVARAYARFGQRYVDRVLAPHERRDLRDRSRQVRYIAGRFAAKEAAIKAWGVTAATPVAWSRVVVEQTRSGLIVTAPHLGAAPVRVSLSVTEQAAYAVALGGRRDPANAVDTVGHGEGLGMAQDTVDATIIEVLDEQARLVGPAGDLARDANLFEAGMTSHASVNVMLGVEDAFDIEFPDALLTKKTFTSIASIADAVQQIQGDEATL